ncbi:hypothetical protein MKW92_009499 [Papaver armeniacum]|nr:hypothetical protein MKW92_009499 [Papaver armeniacum]
MPSFYNLIHLEIMSAGLYDGYGCRDAGNLHCWIVRILLNFLHISPNLESLVFVDGFRNNKSTNNDGWSLDLIPQCLLQHLKSIEFRGFFWNEFEKDLIRLFLKNARVLQRTGSRFCRFWTNSWVNFPGLRWNLFSDCNISFS